MKIINTLAGCGLLVSTVAMATPMNIGSAGDVHFTISIRQGTCELVKDNIDVDMGSVVLQRPVTVGRELNQQSFSIGLKNCADVARVYVTMDGTADATNPDLFALDSGGATGVGLKIKTKGGVPQYPVSTNTTPVEHSVWFDGTNQLNYIASYVPVKTDATIGAANATVNFSVVYE